MGVEIATGSCVRVTAPWSAMRPVHVALAVLVAAIWGLNFVVIEVGLDDFPPLLLSALRYALAALPLLFIGGVAAGAGGGGVAGRAPARGGGVFPPFLRGGGRPARPGRAAGGCGA